MEVSAPKHGLSNLQLELLKLYSRNIPEEDLLAIKALIIEYMANKASIKAQEILEKKGLDIETILNTHIRTPYKPHGKVRH